MQTVEVEKTQLTGIVRDLYLVRRGERINLSPSSPLNNAQSGGRTKFTASSLSEEILALRRLGRRTQGLPPEPALPYVAVVDFTLPDGHGTFAYEVEGKGEESLREHMPGTSVQAHFIIYEGEAYRITVDRKRGPPFRGFLHPVSPNAKRFPGDLLINILGE